MACNLLQFNVLGRKSEAGTKVLLQQQTSVSLI